MRFLCAIEQIVGLERPEREEHTRPLPQAVLTNWSGDALIEMATSPNKV